MTPQRIQNWEAWLTDERLARWNQWNLSRARDYKVNRTTGAKILARLFLGTAQDREELEGIKRRIAE